MPVRGRRLLHAVPANRDASYTDLAQDNGIPADGIGPTRVRVPARAAGGTHLTRTVHRGRLLRGGSRDSAGDGRDGGHPRHRWERRLAVHLQLVDAGGAAGTAVLLRLQDVQPDVPATRADRVGRDVGGVAAYRRDGREVGTVVGHLQVEVLGVPTRALVAGTGVPDRDAVDGHRGAEVDLEELGGVERAELVTGTAADAAVDRLVRRLRAVARGRPGGRLVQREVAGRRRRGTAAVDLELVDAGVRVAVLRRGDDVEPDVPRARAHRVRGHVRGVAAHLGHRGERRT